MTLRDRTLKPPRRCIFCGGGPISDEHIWPRWSKAMFRHSPQAGRDEILVTTVGKAFASRDTVVRERHGATTTKRVRAPCKRCNNTWMSRLETQAKPILEALTTGSMFALNETHQRTLATWALLKLMVAEHSEMCDVTVPQEVRSAFMASPEPGPRFRLFIARCGRPPWNAGFMQHGLTLAREGESHAPTGVKNTKAIAMGFGELFFVAIHTTIPQLYDEWTLTPSKKVIPVWPVLNKNVVWPPPASLDVGKPPRWPTSLTVSSPTPTWNGRLNSSVGVAGLSEGL